MNSNKIYHMRGSFVIPLMFQWKSVKKKEWKKEERKEKFQNGDFALMKESFDVVA